MDTETKSQTEAESRNEDTAEDPIEREIDVFFTPSLDGDTQLYVLQYPLRPNWRPYELDERCEEVRLKPESSEVEIDLSVDLESSNIDKKFANKLNYTKQTLSTSWKPPCANGYAVGLLTGDKLHLHPIHAIVQLRPSLQHLNSGGSKKKNIISTGANATVKIEGSTEEKSIATSKKQCWVPLKYYGRKSDISSRYLRQMMAQESSPINFTMKANDYITALCPGGSKGPSKRHLLSLPVDERLKKMLIEGPPLHRFAAIKDLAPEFSEEELIGFLQQHAVLLWGLWTAKTQLLYPQAGLKAFAREYVLALFNKKMIVESSDVNLPGVPVDHVKNILKELGSEAYDQNKPYWVFTGTADEAFRKDNPNFVEKQEEYFKVLEQHIPKFLQKYKQKSSKSDQRVTSLGEVSPRTMIMSKETHDALLIALKKLFQKKTVCSFQTICQLLREMADSKATLSKEDFEIAVRAAKSLDGPPAALKDVITEVACNIHGYYVLKSSSQDDPFRNVVIDVLIRNAPNATLTKAVLLEVAKRCFNIEMVPKEVYNKVMHELCVSKGPVWVLKSDESMQ